MNYEADKPFSPLRGFCWSVFIQQEEKKLKQQKTSSNQANRSLVFSIGL